jgi:glycosyltransferase involved in cell wall biosynthesis
VGGLGETPARASVEPQSRTALRVAVVGISTDDPCGVRDHAALLAQALAGERIECTPHWLSRTPGSLASARRELSAWTDALAGELRREHADAVLLHYSVFAFAHRGVPLFARPVLQATRAAGLPLVTFMHEYAYPWRLGGVRGDVWAATQRLVLRDVVRASRRLVVSGETRADWLRSRAWLARRPISVAPVFSNLPAAVEGTLGPAAASPAAQAAAPVAPSAPAQARAPVAGRIGLFGFGHEGVDSATVLDALRALREREVGREVELTLLGAPGSPSTAAARWRREAAARGLAGAIGFSGRLPALELAGALAGCEVLLFAERGGATSRKTTLAASLASGRPVVALDGANTWRELSRARAAVIVEPDGAALADAVARLLEDRPGRERQGALGRGFAERAMSVERSASVVGAALIAAIEQARR